MKRKILSLVVAIFLLLPMSVPVFADVMPRDSDTFAGDLYLVVSNDTSLSGYPGHAFIVYKNTSYYSVQIGDMVVHSGEEVTLGTTAVGPAAYYGVWYNLESYKYHNDNELISNVYLHTTVTLMDIASISAYISDWAEYYSLTTHNCVHFARGIWYILTGVDYAVFTPADLMALIIKDPSYDDCLELAEPDKVGYYDNDGFQRVY